ncbi:hypothetical protein Ancab_019608 [Ancistrocladus abbreviatus]
MQGESIFSKCYCGKMKDKVNEVSTISRNCMSRVPPSYKKENPVLGWDAPVDVDNRNARSLVRNTNDKTFQHGAVYRAKCGAEEYVDWQGNLGNNTSRMSQGIVKS